MIFEPINELPVHFGFTLVTSSEDLCFLIQSGRELTVKGIRALEYVGRETLDILASETGFDLETDEKVSEEEITGEVESYTEDVTFDRCFYIYGGPEHMEVSDFYPRSRILFAFAYLSRKHSL